MDTKDIRQLFDYSEWANARVLDAAARLTGEEFTRDLKSSFPSVRDTLAHLLFAEWVWLRRWQGERPRSPFANAAEFSDAEAVRVRLAEVERERAEFVAALTDEALVQVINYSKTSGEESSYPLGRMMQHVVNHSTYHRGQATTLLRQLGAKAPTTDLIYYLDELPRAR